MNILLMRCNPEIENKGREVLLVKSRTSEGS